MHKFLIIRDHPSLFTLPSRRWTRTTATYMMHPISLVFNDLLRFSLSPWVCFRCTNVVSYDRKHQYKWNGTTKILVMQELGAQLSISIKNCSNFHDFFMISRDNFHKISNNLCISHYVDLISLEPYKNVQKVAIRKFYNTHIMTIMGNYTKTFLFIFLQK